MTSKTSLTAAVRRFDVDDVRDSLDERPDLLATRDGQGRNWLHLCCSVDVRERSSGDIDRSCALAMLLLDRGLDLDEPAFTEDDGAWQATPVWYSVARGRNLVLTRFLLDRGASPEHSLWAAAFNDDLDAIDLLVARSARVDARFEGETPFLEAIKTSHFDAAWRLAEHGADVNVRDARRMTALHCMVKKRSHAIHFEAFAAFGPRVDLPGPDGTTAGELLSRVRDPELRRVGELLATNSSA